MVPRFHNMENQFWAVGRWPGLDRGLKGFGPIMSVRMGKLHYKTGPSEVVGPRGHIYKLKSPFFIG